MATDAWNALRGPLAHGRQPAFAELYDRCAGPMYRVARRMLGSDADAEDAVHQAFLDLMRARRALARADDPAAYAVVAARNAAMRLRGRAARTTLDLDEVADAEMPATPVHEQVEALERALSRLPAEQRDVVALKVEGGLTFAAIGAALGVSPNTAASRYRYALERLRRLLEPPPRAEGETLRTTKDRGGAR